MTDFYKFNSQLDDLKGLYNDMRVPPPPPYEFKNYMDLISTEPDHVNCGDARFSQWKGRPLTDDEQTTTTRPIYDDRTEPPVEMDIKNLEAKARPIDDLKISGIKNWGKNLGEPLDDEGFKKYTGIRW